MGKQPQLGIKVTDATRVG